MSAEAPSGVNFFSIQHNCNALWTSRQCLKNVALLIASYNYIFIPWQGVLYTLDKLHGFPLDRIFNTHTATVADLMSNGEFSQLNALITINA